MGQIIEYWKNKSLENLTEYVEEIGLVTEEWESVVGYEGLYQVSNFGRAKSLHREPKILSKTKTDDRGYLRVCFTKNGVTEHLYIHILVGIYFIPNTENKRTVNHRKGNKKDNRYFSLEWFTYSEQHKHAYKELGRVHAAKGKFGYDHKGSKEIICVNNGVKYGSISDAGRKLKIPFQNISKVCKGERNTCNGLLFKFVEG